MTDPTDPDRLNCEACQGRGYTTSNVIGEPPIECQDCIVDGPPKIWLDERDHFAIAALQMLGAATQDETVTSLEDRADDTARACYTVADAMLRARVARGA